MKNMFTAGFMALAIMAITSTALVSADSKTDDTPVDAPQFDQPCQAGEHNDHPHPPEFMGEIERTVTNIDNGVVITMTTENEEALEMLFERFSDGPPMKGDEDESVTHDVELLANGVEITITSDDAEKVADIQARAEEGPKGPHGKGPKGPFGEDESEVGDLETAQ